MDYIVHCYHLMISDGRQYNYADRGSVQHEDFLRNGLVNDYLAKKTNKEFYKNSISDNPNVDITFHSEEANTYVKSGTLKDDYIDISIHENRLSDIWGEETEDQIKFAVECKRIKVPNDYTQYIGDIQKFADRDFTTFRLPVEGQIAFIEKASITYLKASEEINKRLESSLSLTTNSFLSNSKISSGFTGCYSSKHTRNYGNGPVFTVSHMFFDYSKIVIN